MNICQGICKNGIPCKYKSKIKKNGKYFCGIHCKINDTKTDPKPKPKYKSESKFKSNINEEIQLENSINDFCQMKKNDIEFLLLKKQFRKLLLQIHPDKCRYKNLDCNILCDNLINHFNKLKI